MFPPLISGPIPPENNPPITPQYYRPRKFYITDVTLGQTTIVTTDLDVDFFLGNQIRLLIPPEYGCRQLNETQGYILSFPASNQVEVSINSATNVDAFISATTPNKPQILPIGDVNTGVVNTSRSDQTVYIPGSFIDISPV